MSLVDIVIIKICISMKYLDRYEDNLLDKNISNNIMLKWKKLIQ